MSDTPRQVTGTFKVPSGAAYPNETLTWFRNPRKTGTQGGSVVADQIVRVTTNASGQIDTSMLAGDYLVMIRLEDDDRYFRVVVPDTVGPHDVSKLVGDYPQHGIIEAILRAGADVMAAGGEGYETVAEGVAASNNGDFFYVPSEDPDGIFDFYQLLSGTAVQVGTSVDVTALRNLDQRRLPFAFTTNGTVGPFALPSNPISAKQVALFFGGAPQVPTTDFVIVDMPLAESGKGLQFTSAPVAGVACHGTVDTPTGSTSVSDPDLIQMGDSRSVEAWLRNGVLCFPDRNTLKAWIDEYGDFLADGARLSDGALEYQKYTGATDFDDLPGLIVFGRSNIGHNGPTPLAAPDIIAGSVALKPSGGDSEGGEPIDDTLRMHNALQRAAEGGKFLEVYEGIYGIDGYKGVNPTWGAGVYAHGGLIIPAGTRLIGAGDGKVVFRNIADDWRCVINLHPGRVRMSGFTVDGNINNHSNIQLGTTSEFAGTARGEGIITVTTGKYDSLIEHFEVVNTGHYGVGWQSGFGRMALKHGRFANIGGDCVDFKEYASQGKKRGFLLDLHTEDGCGHNAVGLGGVSPHDEQACFDVGGRTIVDACSASGLDSYGTQKGVAGFRFRAAVTADGRNDARMSEMIGCYVSSSKLDTEGSDAAKKVIGFSVWSPGVGLISAKAENCFIGIEVEAKGNSVPDGISIVAPVMRNIKGAEGDGKAIQTGVQSERVKIVEADVEGGDIAYHLRGQDLYVSGTAYGSAVGINTTSSILYTRQIDIELKDCATDVVDEDGVFTELERNLPGDTTFTKERRTKLTVRATANDTAWTGDNAVLGGLYFSKADISTTGDVVVASIEARAAGSSGGTFSLFHSIVDTSGNLVDVMQVDDVAVRYLVPWVSAGYTVATLPTPPETGMRAHVTDASATLAAGIGSVVSEGGANTVPVFYDGTNWRIG